MLDIRFIRENAQLVEKKAEQKGYKVDVKHLLKLDDDRRRLLVEIESVREQRNQLAEQLKSKKPTEEEAVKGQGLKKKLKKLELELEPIETEFMELLKKVPNIPADDVPVGTSEVDNVVTKKWGQKPEFDFEPKNHWEIAETRGLIDKARAAKVAGSRFAYLKGDLVRLQLAIVQFTIDSLTNESTIKKIVQFGGLKDVSFKPFIPVLPPAMIRSEVFDAMDRLEPREERYQVGTQDDNLWLQGSAEHTLGPMYMGEILPAEDLPIRYLGYLTSFRREAGSYGKDIEGIIRMHQFDKLEMESFSLPQDGMSEHLFMVAVQEYLMQQLNLPYHVLNKCTADIGKPNARGVDLEAWLPGHGRYLETHTADFMTDYQARRLNTRAKTAEGTVIVHINDATALAPGRTIIAIIENYQTAGGKVGIPTVLRPYMGGQLTI